MQTILRAAAIVLLAFTAPLSAHEIMSGDLEIIHPNIPAVPGMAKSAAGYMVIANNGETADHLIGIETGIAAKAEVHETVMEGDVAKMQAVPDLEIPADDTVVLEPGGLHVMLMGLTGPLVEDAMVPATLIFEHAGRVEIEFVVGPPGGMDHASHMDGMESMDGMGGGK